MVKTDIKRLGLRNMTIKGFSDVGELMKSMKESSFVVLPSAYEACPMIILEAMCLGKIPVMFDLPYAREITDDGKYGILATDVDDMVTTIGRIIDTCSVEGLQERIRKYSQVRYNADRMAREYLHLYEMTSN
jgi:glycosyltransferase involved in cell wall biosynthesis